MNVCADSWGRDRLQPAKVVGASPMTDHAGAGLFGSRHDDDRRDADDDLDATFHPCLAGMASRG